MSELLGFFDRLQTIQGSAVYAALQEDPDIIDLIAKGHHRTDSKGIPLFGFTKQDGMLTTLIELKIGKALPRPKIPGLEARKNRVIKKTKSAVELAQQRNAARKSKRE